MSKHVETVLFTSNLSETSRVAFNQVAMLAAQLDARIVLLHVIEKAPESYESRLKSLFGEKKWNEILLHHIMEINPTSVGE